MGLPYPVANFIQETLDWCNTIRLARGLKPLDRLPKGNRRNPESCPCGKAAHASVRTYEAVFANMDGEIIGQVPVPRGVQEFIRAFDAGMLPEYDKDAKPGAISPYPAYAPNAFPQQFTPPPPIQPGVFLDEVSKIGPLPEAKK